MSRAKTLTSWIVSMLVIGIIGAGAGPIFAEPYQVIDVTDGGTIFGVARWNGDLPELQPIEIEADTGVCGEEAKSQALLVNSKNSGVSHVLVYLEQVKKGKAPADKYRLDMANCQFTDHIFPFVRSQTMAMVNHDSYFHNPHFFNAKNVSLLNVPMPDPNQQIEHKFLRTPLRNEKGVMRLQCDVHNNMNAYWAGFDHPYFALTDANGRFVISGVPPGTYTLVAWHEGYKIIREEAGRPIYDRPHTRQQEIEIKPQETITVGFEFPVRKVYVDY
ncbi:MAG: carboxypeptidase regulatory-like domain-containing protein [Nitrospiraceae bacterium]